MKKKRKENVVQSIGAAIYLPLCWMVVLAAIMTGCAGGQKSSPIKDMPEIQPRRPAVCGFYTNGRGPWSSYTSLSGHFRQIDEISPLWYHLEGDGSLREEVDQEVLRLAWEKGIKILPLVAMGPGGRGTLLDPQLREKAAFNIAGAILEKGYDGINIDIELIKTAEKDYGAERDGLTDIVSLLGEKLKPLGKRLDVCVIPPMQPPSHLAQIYDYKSLSGVAHRVVLMAYDHSHPGTSPGPVAPLPWVEANINALLACGLQPDEISLGVAAYGYDWPAGKTGGHSRPSGEIIREAEKSGIEMRWDLHSQSPYIKYHTAGGGSREVWFENGEAAGKKLDLAAKYNLAGVSIWRLGYEEPAFWNKLTANI